MMGFGFYLVLRQLDQHNQVGVRPVDLQVPRDISRFEACMFCFIFTDSIRKVHLFE
jgi:hypothetical protein